MDFQPSARSVALVEQLQAFIDERIVPAQHAYDAAVAAAPGEQPTVMEELKAAAKADGLWNLCIRPITAQA